MYRSRRSFSIQFSALPNVCQDRFIQICPIKTLHNFSCTNKYYQQLSSKRPTINSAFFETIYIRGCWCHKEYCLCFPGKIKRKISLKNIKERYEVQDLVEIKNRVSILHPIQQPLNMPVNFSIKEGQLLRINECLLFTELNLETYMIDFNALMVLVKQPLKKFTFKGGINFVSSYLYYKNGFEEISNIQWVRYGLYPPSLTIKRHVFRFTIILSTCAYTNATAEQISFFLMDNVKGFTEHYYEEKEIIYNNLTRKEAILQCTNNKPSV